LSLGSPLIDGSSLIKVVFGLKVVLIVVPIKAKYEVKIQRLCSDFLIGFLLSEVANE